MTNKLTAEGVDSPLPSLLPKSPLVTISYLMLLFLIPREAPKSAGQNISHQV